MSHPTRRGRARAATDKDIRRTARALLVEQGPEAVTLRAIARELGITAPALYRYYESRDDLLENLRLDVIADLSLELAEQTAALPDDGTARLFGVCRGFRRWSLGHPKEFTARVRLTDRCGEQIRRAFRPNLPRRGRPRKCWRRRKSCHPPTTSFRPSSTHRPAAVPNRTAVAGAAVRAAISR